MRLVLTFERATSSALDDVVGVERDGREVEERVDLRHGAVDAPARPHLAPVEDELARHGGECLHDVQLFLSRQKLQKVAIEVKAARLPRTRLREGARGGVADRGYADASCSAVSGSTRVARRAGR